MGDSNEYFELEQEKEELTRFIEAAPDRIRSYYSEDHPQPEDYPALNTPPAQIIVEDAADLIQYEFKLSKQRDIVIFDGNWAQNRSFYTNIAIAVELLLNAHFMKGNPMEYAEKLENGDTLNLEKAKKEFMGNPGIKLSGAQRKRICLVVDLLKIKRNNIVHAGFHSQDHQGVTAPMYEVIRFLFAHISEEDLDVIAELESAASNIRESGVGRQTKKIEFPI